MSTVNNRAVKTSGTDVLSSWKKLRKTSERAGAGVWLPPPSYVRTSEGYYVKIWGRQLPIRFNFWSKNQLRKTEKYRILIKDLISNKWKCKTKEAGLILQSGIYIYLLHLETRLYTQIHFLRGCLPRSHSQPRSREDTSGRVSRHPFGFVTRSYLAPGHKAYWLI